MVGQLKEDVAEWYQGLSAHMRIEAMCTLIDLSMPFEIRFLGSLIEHLGRKDFGSLRDAEAKANSFANANPDDKKKLLQSLGEVTTGPIVNGTQYINPLMHQNNFNESPANRPSPTHSVEAKGRQNTGSTSDTFHGCDHHNDHALSNEPSANSHDCAGPKGNSKGASSISNHIGCSSEEETESMCIVNDLKRRKLILYISVLAPTNHDGANLYYTVLSDIDDSPALAWLEDLDKDAQEEVSLLYTLASRHPAFTFEQRMFLATVANRVNEIISSKYSSRGNTTPQQTAQTHQSTTNPPGAYPVYYNHAALPQMDPKYATGYYFVAHPSMHIQQSPHQPSVTSNGEPIRNSAVSTPFPAYASFGPYFVSPHHPAALQHPTALNPQFAPIPIPSPASASGQNLQQQAAAPAVACSNNATVPLGNSVPGAPSNNNHHLSSSKSQNSLPPPHVSPASVSNSISQPSCLSPPSRTSSSVPFQSEANSVDGDSEESSENCDWNSPESSPFESPPQSLTPSRSQSPPSGIPSSTSVQTVSLSGHSSTFLVTSNGGSFVGPVVSSGSNSGSSSSSTIVKTEIHTNSGLVITTATSASSCSTSSSSNNNFTGGNASGLTNSNCNNSSSSSNNNSVNAAKTSSSATSVHHLSHQQPPPPSQTGHHPPPSVSSVRGGGQIKGSSSVPGNNNSQSFSNHPTPPSAVISSTVISVSQQQQQPPPPTLPQSMMGPTVPVHMQQTSVLTSVNNAGGIVSHSMSSANPPLPVGFAQQTHGAHNSLGLNNSMPPPSQNSYPCFPHLNAAVSFGGMNAAAAYRAPSQGVLTRNPYVQSHNVAAAANALLGNQMVIKGNDVQRGHSVHGSLRQKTPLQNTPKRRSNVSGGGLVNMPAGIVGPHPNNCQSTSGKGDEVSESSKDRTNEIVVSANPTNNKGASQTERTSGGGGKPYHQHVVTNGLVNALTNTSAGTGGVLPNNPLPNHSANSNSIPPPQAAINSSANPGGQLMQTATAKSGDDGLLGDGGAVLDNYPVNQLPYHMNVPHVYGHPAGPYIQLPNGYLPTFNYPSPSNMAAAVATMSGGPPMPPSTEIMMNPAGVPHFSFPFTIPQSFSSPPSSVGNKGISNAKDSNKSSSLHTCGNSGGGGANPVSSSGGSGDSNNSKVIVNQHENHGHPPPAYQLGYYTTVSRTPSQPNRNSRGVILDIGGALGNNSFSPVNVDVAVMPPLDELVDTLHRPRKISCYNCGASTHLGPDCKEGSMEEMTRHQFRVNYSGPSSVTADGKDGD